MGSATVQGQPMHQTFLIGRSAWIQHGSGRFDVGERGSRASSFKGRPFAVRFNYRRKTLQGAAMTAGSSHKPYRVRLRHVLWKSSRSWIWRRALDNLILVVVVSREWTPESIHSPEEASDPETAEWWGTCCSTESVSGHERKGVWSEGPDPLSVLLEALRQRTLTEFVPKHFQGGFWSLSSTCDRFEGAGGILTLRKPRIKTRRYGLTSGNSQEISTSPMRVLNHKCQKFEVARDSKEKRNTFKRSPSLRVACQNDIIKASFPQQQSRPPPLTGRARWIGSTPNVPHTGAGGSRRLYI